MKELLSCEGRRVSVAYLLVHFLSVPFWGLLYLLPMVLYKDCHASSFTVATCIACKPMVSLLSPYWSQWIHNKRQVLLPNLYIANILKFFPFIWAPWISEPWYYVGAFGLFMMLSRGTIPAWMEVVKISLHRDKGTQLCAFGSAIDFVGSALLPLLVGGVLDRHVDAWRWLIAAAAFLGLVSTFSIFAIKKGLFLNRDGNTDQAGSCRYSLGAPWRNCKEILSARKDFLGFQLGFFLGGAGLMIIHPILPMYFTDSLKLSYTGMLMAMATCKGIGLICSSPIWVRSLKKNQIFSVCAYVTGFATLFPFVLKMALWQQGWVYVAYLIYGIMQGGSELSWKMSGAMFAKEKDSSPYSSINVLMVGIRGMIFPYLGSVLFFLFGSSQMIFTIATILSISATGVMILYRHRYGIRSVV